MRACWMFLMLLSCRLSHATKSQNICNNNNQIKIVCVPAGEDVSVSCPKFKKDDEVIFSLYKDNEVIFNHTCVGKKDAPNCKPQYTRAGVEMRENTDNTSFSFMLTRVNASSYGIYGCEGVCMYPPPLVEITLWIMLLVDGHQCNFKENRTPETTRDQRDEFIWIWILGLALLCLYSLIITAIASIIWVKWRRSDSQSDYINTKPKAHRDRKKKKGVQIPIPRHF
ncbi:T-cell-specific surface glycoprotein CD28 [Anoplopoma fimbria]|uniref:T-cell-specific surface glycoprotein CD28 n=1 Tax=Anoplopoma fimbria TaxID=229290 RepID=UPI0023EB4C3B|nr:T-cell-specific surface glycoprotein CD28 [Anoplopoma fimbria]